MLSDWGESLPLAAAVATVLLHYVVGPFPAFTPNKPITMAPAPLPCLPPPAAHVVRVVVLYVVLMWKAPTAGKRQAVSERGVWPAAPAASLLGSAAGPEMAAVRSAQNGTVTSLAPFQEPALELAAADSLQRRKQPGSNQQNGLPLPLPQCHCWLAGEGAHDNFLLGNW